MDPTNIVYLGGYHKEDEDIQQGEGHAEDLVTAIQSLIKRLRDAEPIKQAG